MRFHYFFLPPGSVTQFLFLYMFYNNIYILDTNNNNNNDKLVMYITSDPERTYNIVNLVASTHFFFYYYSEHPEGCIPKKYCRCYRNVVVFNEICTLYRHLDSGNGIIEYTFSCG